MSLPRLRHYALMFITAATAMTLPMFLTTPVPAATLGRQAAMPHSRPGAHSKILQIQVPGKPQVLVGNAICLKNAHTHCAAFDPLEVYSVILSSINTAILIWKTVHDAKTGDNEAKSEGDEGGDEQTNGLCLGETGNGGKVKVESCSVAHGTWWDYVSYRGGYRILNRYLDNKGSYQILTAKNTRNGTKLYTTTPKSGTWQKWTFEFCDGC